MNTQFIYEDLRKIREQKPLVHNITNFVGMNNTANALLAIGASPVMAHAKEEVEDMAAIASALVLNIGTLSPEWVDSMKLAGEVCKGRTPIVLDPVGVGATAYRTRVAKEIIEACRPSVIRGNASEINALYDNTNQTKGVDSTIETSNVVDAAKQLSKLTGAVIVISGPVDYIVDNGRVASIFNGNKMMPFVTAMGCTATALMGAFLAVDEDVFNAAISCMAVMGITGERAVAKSVGPGSLQVNFLDELYNLDEEKINSHLKYEYKTY